MEDVFLGTGLRVPDEKSGALYEIHFEKHTYAPFDPMGSYVDWFCASGRLCYTGMLYKDLGFNSKLVSGSVFPKRAPSYTCI